ncbi:MAG: hypothetical protein JXA49_08595 [Actinobacteria bacterium]|nr:hypothetical protein [Actinomycetota bacterium]
MKFRTPLVNDRPIPLPDIRLNMIDESTTLEPGINLSREKHYWLLTEGDYARVWRNSDCVVLGRFLKPEEEVRVEEAEALGIPVLKRTSGGGAVFHDRGNINYSLYLDSGSATGWPALKSFETLSFPVTSLLEMLDIPWTWVPPNNIYVEGGKISGSAQARRNGRVLHHGTVLVDADLGRMKLLLREDGRSRSAPTVNLKELVPGVSVKDIEVLLNKILTGCGE